MKKIFEYIAISIARLVAYLFISAVAVLVVLFVLSLPEILGVLIFG